MRVWGAITIVCFYQRINLYYYAY